MRKIIGTVIAVVVVLGVAGAVWLRPGSSAASPQQAPASAAVPIAKAPFAKAAPTATAKDAGATLTTYSVKAGGLQRAYQVFTPVKALQKTAPVLVMLGGITTPTESGAAVVNGESGRDYLIPYAAAGKAEVVYPEPMYGSWNAIGCCGKAYTSNVDDVAFLQEIVANVDPGHARQIDIIGYSNGARLAYRMACSEPGLFDQYAMVKGEPLSGCNAKMPASIIQLASVDDPEVPFKPGDHGSVESLPTTTLVASLRTADSCPAAGTSLSTGQMTQTTWSGCAGGTRIALAAWSTGVHAFLRPPNNVPAASAVIWAFFTRTPIAPLP